MVLKCVQRGYAKWESSKLVHGARQGNLESYKVCNVFLVSFRFVCLFVFVLPFFILLVFFSVLIFFFLLCYIFFVCFCFLLKCTWEVSEHSLAFVDIKLSINDNGLSTSVHYNQLILVFICCIRPLIHNTLRVPFQSLNFSKIWFYQTS